MHSVMSTGKQGTAHRMLNLESEGSGSPFADALIGAVPAAASAAGVSCIVEKVGPLASLKFTLAAVDLDVTDAGGSGSSASLKIFDFVAGALFPLASRQDYTLTDETGDTNLISGGVGDAVFQLALGSVAADAGDGTLTSTEVDFAPVSGNITNAAGVGALSATKVGGVGAVIDGTSTAADLYLNWSGTATTIDANGVIAITGTITLLVLLLGDD